MLEPIALAFSLALLSLLFLAGGGSKLRAHEAFIGVVYNYRLLPEAAVQPVAYAVPVVELAIGLGLTLPPTRPYAAAGAALLLAVFTVAIAINLGRGRREIDCGCFSSELKQRLSGWLVARNLALLAMALWVSGAAQGVQTIGWLEWLLGATVAGMVALFYMAGVLLAAAAQRSAHRSVNEGVK